MLSKIFNHLIRTDDDGRVPRRILAPHSFLQGGCQMMTRLTPSAAYLGIALGFILAPAVSKAQQADFKAAVAAKIAAGQEARAHMTPDAANPVGTFISFDVPGAVNGTYPYSIDPAGTIYGISFDANFIGHGFVRASNGTITTFAVPGAVNGLSPPFAVSP